MAITGGETPVAESLRRESKLSNSHYHQRLWAISSEPLGIFGHGG